MKTIAAILVEQKKPLIIDEIEVPPLSIGQVLVNVKTTRICGSQLGEIDGVKGPDRYLPLLLGHEGAGIVLEVGPEVTRVKPGDYVVLHWRPAAGLQISPPMYRWRGKDLNAGWITTFNQMTIVAENRVTPIPHDFDLTIAPLLADTLTTGFGVINNNAQAKIGESLVLFGSGGIGLGVILGAHLAGLHPIIAIDRFDHKLAKAQEYGATHTINADQENAQQRVLEILGSQGADIVVDGTGVPEVIETCYQLTQRQGRCVLFGVMSHDKRVTMHTLPLHFGKTLIGSEGGGSHPDHDIPKIIRMIQDRRFDPKGFISHQGPLDQINELIAKMRSGEVVHALINFDK